MSVVGVNSLIATRPPKATVMTSNSNAYECMSLVLGFRGIERVTGVHHTTVIYWVKQVGNHLPDAYDPNTIPQVGELDELETFIGAKETVTWLWTAVDHEECRYPGMGVRRPQYQDLSAVAGNCCSTAMLLLYH